MKKGKERERKGKEEKKKEAGKDAGSSD